MKLYDYLSNIELFLKEYLKNSKLDSYVLGLSGGVDSTLVAAIARTAVGKDKLFCYAIDIESNKKDIEDAEAIAKLLDLNLEIINLTETYHNFLNTVLGNDFKQLTKSNLKVRMRMVTLYAFAQEHNALVLGTDNKDERYVGYFTKYGDGAVDLLPIVHLTKSEVVEGCKYYNIDSIFANKIPSAGLFEGQTEEDEMKVSYKELDDFLLGKEISKVAKERIEYLHKISEHKRIPIPEMEEFKRD